VSHCAVRPDIVYALEAQEFGNLSNIYSILPVSKTSRLLDLPAPRYCFVFKCVLMNHNVGLVMFVVGRHVPIPGDLIRDSPILDFMLASSDPTVCKI
jgi:hypothetical protein